MKHLFALWRNTDTELRSLNDNIVIMFPSVKKTNLNYYFSLFLVLTFMVISPTAQAQFGKVLHHTIEFDKEVKEISFDIYGEYVLESWEGNMILIETEVKLYNAKESILEFFVGNGRYDVLDENSGSQLSLKSKDFVRRSIQSKSGTCEEYVNVKIFIPDDFTIMGDNKAKRGGQIMAKDEKSEKKTDNLAKMEEEN